MNTFQRTEINEWVNDQIQGTLLSPQNLRCLFFPPVFAFMSDSIDEVHFPLRIFWLETPETTIKASILLFSDPLVLH